MHDFSNVFKDSEFKGDVSKWDVSVAIKMDSTVFSSKFNGDLSGWDVKNLKYARGMFAESEFDNDSIKGWNVKKLKDAHYMFGNSKFSKDVSDWNLKSLTFASYMFYQCQVERVPIPRLKNIEANHFIYYMSQSNCDINEFGERIKGNSVSEIMSMAIQKELEKN